MLAQAKYILLTFRNIVGLAVPKLFVRVMELIVVGTSRFLFSFGIIIPTGEHKTPEKSYTIFKPPT
jgi:hypothetical protein